MIKIYTTIFIFYCLSIFCMDCTDVIIKTSDKKNFNIPRWQIRESNTLYTLFLQQLQKSPDIKPIIIETPTVSYKEIKLYSTAHNQENFDDYYNSTLTPQQQKMLIIAAGEHARNEQNELVPKLHDVALSMKLLHLNCDTEMLKEHLYPFFSPLYSVNNSIQCIIDHFKRTTIINNALQKKYTQGMYDYAGPFSIYQHPNGSYYKSLPSLLIDPTKQIRTALCNGISNFSPLLWTQDNSSWNVLQQLPFTNNTISYIVTPTKPLGIEGPANSINLWMYNKKEKLLKQIDHTYTIDQIVFSSNGKYLAVSSTDRNYNNGQLSVTSLEIENDILKNNDDIFITDNYSGWNDILCFNNVSTTLVIGIDNILKFWDVKSGKYITSLTFPGKSIKSLCFNAYDTRLAIASYDYEKISDEVMCSTKYMINLYNIEELLQPILIKTIELIDSNIFIEPFSMEFYSEENKLVIGTTNHALIINDISGEIIMATDKVTVQDKTTLNMVAPLLMPRLNILTTLTGNMTNSCNLQLWDVQSKKLITTLINNQTQLLSVGMTFDNFSLISMFHPHNNILIETNLCDASLYKKINNLLNTLTIFQLYCLYRIDKENNCYHKKNFLIHEKSLIYKGIKTLPKNIKNVMYSIFHILKVYGSKK